MSDEEDLIQLVYGSRATVACDGPFLKALLEKARNGNARLGVSGVFLYHTASFMQVLEGAPDVVTALFGSNEIRGTIASLSCSVERWPSGPFPNGAWES